MMKAIGNRNANDFWEYHLSPDKRINSDTSSATRMAHIEDKYKAKLYCDKSIISDNPRVLNEVNTCTLHRNSEIIFRVRQDDWYFHEWSEILSYSLNMQFILEINFIFIIRYRIFYLLHAPWFLTCFLHILDTGCRTWHNIFDTFTKL